MGTGNDALLPHLIRPAYLVSGPPSPQATTGTGNDALLSRLILPFSLALGTQLALLPRSDMIPYQTL